MEKSINSNQSILTSIKKLLGIAEECLDFDTDIIMHINDCFMTLHQLGVCQEKEMFSISDSTTLWTDYIEDSYLLNTIKDYVYLKVRLIFDPPINSSVTESINKMISEKEWRINIAVN